MNEGTALQDQVDALVFDVVGTLVDDEGSWARVVARLAAEAGLDDDAALLSSWTEGLGRRMDAVVTGEAPWRPHRQLVSDAARDAITKAGGNPSPSALSVVAFLDDEYWAWPDVAPATAALRRDRLVVGLSNADPDSLARLANANAISWDLVLSAGTIGTFKPAPAAYRYAVNAIRLDPSRTLFVAAHPRDLRAATEHGFRTAYVARPGAERPAGQDHFDLEIEDVSALADLLGA